MANVFYTEEINRKKMNFSISPEPFIHFA